MDYRELLAKVEQDFGQKFTVYKEKAGYLMLSPNGILLGPDCGHSCPSKAWAIELQNGWGYMLIDGTWYRLRDGCIGLRKGPDLFPGLLDTNASPF